MGRNFIINDENPFDDILEGWYKLRIRVFEKLKTVLKLYDLKIHQNKLGPDDHRLKTMVKRSIEKNYESRNLRSKMEIMKGTPWRIRDTTAWTENPGRLFTVEIQRKCSAGDNCSFRHGINERAKSTLPNPSPSSFMRQNERNASRIRSPRDKSTSGRMSRWPCKDYFKETCTNSFCEKRHPPICFFYKSGNGCRFGKSARMRIVRLKNNLTNRFERMMTKLQLLCWRRRRMSIIMKMYDLWRMFTHQIHDNWVAFSRIRGPKSSSIFTEELRHRETDPMCEIHKSSCTSRRHSRQKSFARIDLSGWTSSAPKLQNLRIGLRKRQSGKSKVPAKKRAGQKYP